MTLREQLAGLKDAAAAYQLPRVFALLVTLLTSMVDKIEKLEREVSHGK